MMRSMLILLMIFAAGASGVHAEVNDILTFTNFTDEEIYVELSVFGYSDHRIYDIYVLPDYTSIADFWADSIDATYTACAYGEITGDYYGCIDGSLLDFYKDIYFDHTGEPYLSAPSNLPTEWFVFDNPYSAHIDSGSDVYISGSGSGGCFISALGR